MTVPAKPRVLILTDRGERQQKWALQYAPDALEVIIRRTPAHDELFALLPNVNFIISERNQPVTAEMIAATPRLKLIVRLGSLGHDIDYEAAHTAGVQVSVQPVLGTIYDAEHALMMILAVTKKLGRGMSAALAADHGMPPHRTTEDVFAFNWLGFKDVGGVIGRRIAIFGMGEIGAELARMLRGLRPAAVLYNKRKPYPAEVEAELAIRFADRNTCLESADIVVSLLPYTPETDYLNADGSGLTRAALNKMQRGAYVVHLGSGSVLDEMALLELLQAGKLGGAALDTYEFEPLQGDHPLVKYARNPDSNLLLTPHVAGAALTLDRSDDYAEIIRFLAGEPLHYARG